MGFSVYPMGKGDYRRRIEKEREWVKKNTSLSFSLAIIILGNELYRLFLSHIVYITKMIENESL